MAVARAISAINSPASADRQVQRAFLRLEVRQQGLEGAANGFYFRRFARIRKQMVPAPDLRRLQAAQPALIHPTRKFLRQALKYTGCPTFAPLHYSL